MRIPAQALGRLRRARMEMKKSSTLFRVRPPCVFRTAICLFARRFCQQRYITSA